MQTMIQQFQAARRVSTPLIAIRTPDPAATIAGISAAANGSAPPLIQWDACRGLSHLNDKGATALAQTGEAMLEGLDIVSALLLAPRLPEKTLLFIHNAPRVLDNLSVIQALWNLRDVFKSNYRALVMLGPDITLPPELTNDVLVLDEPLPDADELATIIADNYEAAQLEAPSENMVAQAVGAVAGLAAFPADQVVAMSLTPQGLNMDALWGTQAAND